MKNHSILLILTLAGLLIAREVQAQSTQIDKYLENLQAILKQGRDMPLQYRLAIDWKNRDIDGKSINHNLVTGTMRRNAEGDSTKWSNVILTEYGDSSKKVTLLKELESLRYKISGDNVTKPGFYKDFPQNRVDIIRWLVQDEVAFNTYGLMFLDSLKLNHPYYPSYFSNLYIKVDNYVNFNAQALNITWTGISKRNHKTCALIHYQGMYNPIDANNDAMKLNGRSCYWGDVWVSLDERKIEYATMNEDLVFKMSLKANNYEQRINLQREVSLERIH